jgi:hypothetical protein
VLELFQSFHVCQTSTFPCILFLSTNIGIIERFLGGQCSACIPIVLPVATVQLLDSIKLELVKSISLKKVFECSNSKK